MGRRSQWPCAVLLLGGVLLLTLGALGVYGRAAVLDERAFADRAAQAFSQDEVQDEIAARISVREVEAVPALAPLRPTLDAAVANVVGGYGFAETFRAGTVEMHRSLFTGRSVDLTLPGAGAELQAALPPRSRALQLLPSDDPQLFHLGGGTLGIRAGRRGAGRAPPRRPGAGDAGGGLALLIASAWRAQTRRRGARRAALGVGARGRHAGRGDDDRAGDGAVDLRHEPRRRRRGRDLGRVPRRPAPVGTRWRAVSA